MVAEVLIIGAGLSGLSCAHRLHQHGISFQILEASDDIGGRIRTDVIDGFRLDRGFQVFLTSYPTAAKILNHDQLRLRPFLAGALVHHDGCFHELADPWRRPVAAIRSLTSSVGTWADKLRIAKLRANVLHGTIEQQFSVPETTSLQELEQRGFSQQMINGFFKPFLGGVFLEPELKTSNRFFRFVFRMFSEGAACLPEQGMQAIPLQVAAQLPETSIRLRTPVANLRPSSVVLSNGEEIRAKAIVVAVDGPSAARLLNTSIAARGNDVTCLYFAADEAPLRAPILLLNGDGWGPINNLCFPTNVAPTYGPKNKCLICVTVLGTRTDRNELLAEVQFQLTHWFGSQVKDWQHLRTYSIAYALPAQLPGTLDYSQLNFRRGPGIYACGDYQIHSSIEGAIVAGQGAADCVLHDLS